MNSSRESSHSSVNAFLDAVTMVLRASRLEGAEGLYFRVANAAATVTGGKHAVVVLPSGPKTLRVAGCWGLPTTVLEEFPATRGIIGREFRRVFEDKKYLILDDISQDRDYHCFDHRVQSELLVPIFDPDRQAILAVVNVEAHRKNHFTQEHAEMIFRIGDVMVECQKHLLTIETIQNDCREHLFAIDKSEKRNKCLLKILKKIPDELLIIDRNFRPLYANEVKRKHLEKLDEYLTSSSHDMCDILSATTNPSKNNADNSCYSLIEDQPGICSGCVCDKAMKSKRLMQGIVYKPHVNDAVVELSAAPMFAEDDDAVVGCIELARYVTQREKVLQHAPELLKDYDQDLLLQDIVNRLCEELKYDRVRLYSLRDNSNLLRGVTYAGKHNRIKRT